MKFKMYLGAAAVILGAFAVLSGVIAPVSVQAEQKTVKEALRPSVFKKDKDGVLWFEQGDDGETKYSASMILSAKIDGIVILVIGHEKHIKSAVGLAMKMRNALQKNKDTPDHIPVVAFKDEKVTASYRFYSDGM